MNTKVCNACGEEKPINGFHKRKSRSKGLRKVRNSDQRESKCKTCKNLTRKNYANSVKRPRKTFATPSSEKICTVCKTLKPLGEFFNDKYAKDGHSFSCKACDLRRKQAYRQKNPEKHQSSIRESNYKKNYGISIDDYNEMFAQQRGKCAICGTTIPGRGYKHFSVDHDHVTGLVRGLLCVDCNHGLGFFKDDKESLKKAIQYLTR